MLHKEEDAKLQLMMTRFCGFGDESSNFSSWSWIFQPRFMLLFMLPDLVAVLFSQIMYTVTLAV